VRLATYALDGTDGAHVGEIVGDRVRELAASSMVSWLSGEGLDATGVEHAVDGVRLLAPLPAPPSYRDFMLYQGHAERAIRNIRHEPNWQLPERWHEVPVFYYGNTGSIHGPGQPVRRPDGVEHLDFELEIAAVIGRDEEIAGFTILNDWSARDLQAREMPVGMGAVKSKDFATSLGPWLVTPDELPYEGGRLALTGRVVLNGTVISETSTELQRFGFDEMCAYAGRNTRLRPGDVLATGTLDYGCIAELGPVDQQRWLQPGDRLSLIVDGLGELHNTIE
jgi:fumarylacetoacetate (FAA) hydrolase